MRKCLRSSALAIFGLFVSVGLASEPNESSPSDKQQRPTVEGQAASTKQSRNPFKIRVVDPQGKSVSGALVGQLAGRIADRGPDWEFAGVIENSKFLPAVTDDAGETRMFVDDIARQDLALVARHASRKLVGHKKISKDQLAAGAKNNSTIVVSMQVECRVRGKLSSDGLTQLGQKLKGTVAQVEVEGVTLLEFNSSHQDYEFFLPPGKYLLTAYGGDTVVAQRPFQIPLSKAELDLDVLDLPPTNMARLIGKPAPDIRDVIAWKNTKPLRLADLHGKYVLLDFWGYWCGGCVQEMPDLIKLHEKYADRVVLIGVHVGLEGDGIDTVAKLDAKLAPIRKEIWNGSDLPFPVVMVSARETAVSDSESTVRSQAAVDYGVRLYPSMVVISPEGNVLGWFDEAEHVKLFETLPKSH